MEDGLLTLTKGERLSYGKLLYFIKDGRWSHLTLTKGERLSYGKLLYFIKDGRWSVHIDKR